MSRATPAMVVAVALFLAACSSPAASDNTSGRSAAITSTGAPSSGTSSDSAATASVSMSATATESGASSAVDTPAPPPEDAVTDVVTGLEAPWSIVFVDGAPLVSQRDAGTILELVGGTLREVGKVEGVEHNGEGGLLGLAVLPGSPTYLYAYFTSEDDNRIVRYELTGSAGSYGLGEAQPVFSGIPKAGNHDGGRIAFGPDGLLYVTAGDAGNSDAAQDPNSLSGKILRLTTTGDPAPGNPIAGNPMYTMGHRNPQGIGWQADGTMWAAEFGQNTWDELNKITPGTNYGWPIVEGVAGDARFADPVQQWATSDASPSGLAVVGDTIYIAALKGERLIAVSATDPTDTAQYFVGEYGRLRDVTIAPDGKLWVLTNNTDGRGDPQEGDDRIIALAAP